MCIWVSQGRLSGSLYYNWMQYKLWGPTSVLLYVINHVLPCIWITLLQRRRLLQTCQGTGWGKGRAELRRKACKWPWAQRPLPWAGGSTGGKCWPDQIKTTQGVSLRTETAFSLQNLPCLCSAVSPVSPPWAANSSSNKLFSPNSVPRDFLNPKGLGSDGWQTTFNIRQQAFTLKYVAQGSHSKYVSGFPGERRGSPWETTLRQQCSNHPTVPLLMLLMGVSVALNRNWELSHLSVAGRQFLEIGCSKATDKHFYSLNLNIVSFLLGELPSLNSRIYWLLTFT